MNELTISRSCFERQIKVVKELNPLYLHETDFSAIFLLKEMLRQLYFLNKDLNEHNNENAFELYFPGRLLTSTETEQIENYRLQQPDLLTLAGGRFGVILITSYSVMEICRLNHKTVQPNPYNYAMITLERGTYIHREQHPLSFDIGFKISTDLQQYNNPTPYIICTETSYLNAINNYYHSNGFTSYPGDKAPLPQWLIDDNERGYISDAYKEWL